MAVIFIEKHHFVVILKSLKNHTWKFAETKSNPGWMDGSKSWCNDCL